MVMVISTTKYHTDLFHICSVQFLLFIIFAHNFLQMVWNNNNSNTNKSEYTVFLYFAFLCQHLFIHIMYANVDLCSTGLIINIISFFYFGFFSFTYVHLSYVEIDFEIFGHIFFYLLFRLIYVQKLYFVVCYSTQMILSSTDYCPSECATTIKILR